MSKQIPLGRAGRDLVAKYEDYGMSPTEEQYLQQAARLADALEELEADIAATGHVTEGSRGQSVVNPSVREARSTRDLMAKMLGRIRLPEDAEQDEASMSNWGRAMVRRRWDRRVG